MLATTSNMFHVNLLKRKMLQYFCLVIPWFILQVKRNGVSLVINRPHEVLFSQKMPEKAKITAIKDKMSERGNTFIFLYLQLLFY